MSRYTKCLFVTFEKCTPAGPKLKKWTAEEDARFLEMVINGARLTDIPSKLPGVAGEILSGPKISQLGSLCSRNHPKVRGEQELILKHVLVHARHRVQQPAGSCNPARPHSKAYKTSGQSETLRKCHCTGYSPFSSIVRDDAQPFKAPLHEATIWSPGQSTPLHLKPEQRTRTLQSCLHDRLVRSLFES